MARSDWRLAGLELRPPPREVGYASVNVSASIIWLRLDLRLADNPALQAAIKRGGAVIHVFIHAPEEEAPWQPGGASRWWLH